MITLKKACCRDAEGADYLWHRHSGDTSLRFHSSRVKSVSARLARIL